ncbi:hypothetical protein [Streptomyces aureus]|uniref:hypothetical protein n=1 Tax=Streptomyces aureus TaxID=193461 RepID=UPI000A5EC2DA|nr:hypothetical protein [Streptomyces aureus]
MESPVVRAPAVQSPGVRSPVVERLAVRAALLRQPRCGWAAGPGAAVGAAVTE